MVNASGGDTRPLDGRWMFAILVAVSLSAALFNGFPFLHWDTWGYSGIGLGGGYRSLTPNFMARFLFPLFDIWSLPVVNAVIFSILSICLLRTYLPRTSFGLYLGAVIASWVPFYIGYVMSDVWGLYMIMAMLISLKSKSPLIFLILSISITTHGGHLVLFPLLAVGVVILFEGRVANLTFLFGALVAAILIALFVSLLMNPWGGAHQMRWSILGSRPVNDHREVLPDYCETRAEADFCIHRDLLLSKAKFPDALLWDNEVRERIDRPAFEDASRDFALFTLTRFPLKVTYTTLRTTAKLLLVRRCIITLPLKENPIENMEKLGFQPKSI